MANQVALRTLAAASLVFAVFGSALAQDRPVWEYKVLKINSTFKSQFAQVIDVPEAELNALGKDGWELVGTSIELGTSFTRVNPSQGVIDHNKDSLATNVHPQGMILIFKRQVIVVHVKPAINIKH